MKVFGASPTAERAAKVLSRLAQIIAVVVPLLVTLEREQQGVAPEFTSERTFDDFTTLTRGAVPAT